MVNKKGAAHNAGKNAPEQAGFPSSALRSNAERVRLWHLYHAFGQHLSPVALPLQSFQLERWKDKTLRYKVGRHSLSPELRFYSLGLNTLIEQRPDWKVSFITVNFSNMVTEKLAQAAARTIAGTYAGVVNKRLKKAGIAADWFCVLEDHLGNLHSHCIVAHLLDDEAAVKDCFKQDTVLTNSGIRIQDTYKQRPRKNSKPFVKNQSFINSDALGDYRLAALDIGLADYLSKTLEKKSRYMDKGRCRIYVPNQVRTSAKNLYDAARIKQLRITGNDSALTKLTCHQSMTYLHFGWIPNVSAGEDRQFEQQAIEIDEHLTWQEFRKSASVYDWQYEENALEEQSINEAKQLMAWDSSERVYEKTVTEAESALENRFQFDEPSEREYEESLAEAAVAWKRYIKVQELSERDYEMLVEQAEAVLEEQAGMTSYTNLISAEDKVKPMAISSTIEKRQAAEERYSAQWQSDSNLLAIVLLDTLQNTQKRAFERRYCPSNGITYLDRKRPLTRLKRQVSIPPGLRKNDEGPGGKTSSAQLRIYSHNANKMQSLRTTLQPSSFLDTG